MTTCTISNITPREVISCILQLRYLVELKLEIKILVYGNGNKCKRKHLSDKSFLSRYTGIPHIACKKILNPESSKNDLKLGMCFNCWA